MVGRLLQKIRCQAIAKSYGRRCLAKGYLTKKKIFVCRVHGANSTGAKTLEGKLIAFKNLKQFKHYTNEQLNEYIRRNDEEQRRNH